MDIESNAAAQRATAATPGQSGNFESAALERRTQEDSFIERAEAEPSATEEGVGERVDIRA